jgi:hypothetical protein
MLMSEPEARGPEDYDAPLEWRAPSDYSAATCVLSVAVSASSTLKSAVSATP